MKRGTFISRWIVLIFLLGLLTSGLSAQTVRSRTSQQEGFLAYRCDYQTGTNTALIYATLHDANGLPMPPERYTLVVASAATAQTIPPQRVNVTQATRREPLRMIIVLDITDTMPLQNVVRAISTQLAPQLEVSDAVALITFGGTIAPITPFYTDKNRLINENMLDLEPSFGDNRLYEVIQEAVNQLSLQQDTRQVVVVITDSGRREGSTDQPSAAEIGTRARNAKVQLYPLGIHLYDEPDDDELIALATTSQGYAWIYDEGARSNNEIAGLAVADRLDSLVDTLNSEIRIVVDMQGQTPDANGEVLFGLTVQLDSGLILNDQIVCPLPQLNHSIAFLPGVTDTTTAAPLNIGVTIQSDLTIEQTSVVFRVNDEPVQNSDSTTFTFNPSDFPPGTYSLSAELRDTNDNILATTDRRVTIATQQALELNIISGTLSDLSNPIQFEAVITRFDASLPPVRFTINALLNPTLIYPLGQGAVAIKADGRAIMTVDNLRTEVERLFPGINSGAELQINAFVPATTPLAPPLAVSEIITFAYTPSAPLVQPTVANNTTFIGGTPTSNATVNPAVVVPAAPGLIIAGNLIDPVTLAAIALSVALFIINILLFRQVGRARVRRLINNPDNHDLSDRLMSITVRREGMKQTHVLTKKTVTLGRGTGNDVNLGDDTNVSREHGVIMWRRKRWWYSNRKPRLLARIDGRRHYGFFLGELEPVTELEIGNAKIFFHSSNQQDVSDMTKTNL